MQIVNGFRDVTCDEMMSLGGGEGTWTFSYGGVSVSYPQSDIDQAIKDAKNWLWSLANPSGH